MLGQEARTTPGTPRFSTEKSGKSWVFGTENEVKKCHCFSSSLLCKNLHSNNEGGERLGDIRLVEPGGWRGRGESRGTPTAHLQGRTFPAEVLQGCKPQMAAPQLPVCTSELGPDVTTPPVVLRSWPFTPLQSFPISH